MEVVFLIIAILALIIVTTTVIVMLIFLIPGLTGAPYVPSKREQVEKVFTKLYKLSKKDYLIDLGSGDGIILELAAKHGATTLGLEINPILARRTRRKFKNNSRITIKRCNFYNINFPSETTIIYAYATNLHIKPIYQKIQRESRRLGKPLYLISNAFDHPTAKPLKKLGQHYLYEIVQ